MNKLFTKISTLVLGLTMAIGVGVAVSSSKALETKADTVGNWTQVTATSEIAAGDKIVIVTSYSSSKYYLNNTVSGGHFGGSPFSSSVSNTANGVITLESTGTNNRYKLASRGSTGYITATAAKSGSGAFSGSDTSGWNFSKNTSGDWDIVYNSKSAYLRAYQSTFRTYNGKSNNACLIYKYSSNQLDTPVPTYDNDTKKVSWVAVDHATSYEVKVDNGSYATATSPYDVSGLSENVQHTVYVVAKASGYTDSEAGSVQFTPTTPASYTSVSVSAGNQVGTDIGKAYIQCSATAQGTNIPVSPSFTWYVTNSDTYATTTSITGKASIDNTGKVTFKDNCTVYVWALAPDGSTHNTSGYAITSSNLKGIESNPYSVSEAKALADEITTSGQNNGFPVYCIGKVSAVGGSLSSKATDPVTFTIKDLDDNSKTLLAFSIQGGSSTDEEATNYVAVDYEVLIFGYLINYSGTREIGYVSSDVNSSGFVYSHEPSLPEITAIALNTENVTTEFDLNSTFNYNGLVVTATVDGVSGVALTSSDYSVSSPDMTTSGQKTVTVTYTGSTYSHDITISNTYTITVIIPSADETIALITAIGTVVYTQESYNKIAAARASYNALPSESQANVTNYSALTDAESTFSTLVSSNVSAVETAISNIGTVTLSSKSAIDTAQDAYDALLDDNLGKGLVSNYSVLTAAKDTYNQLVLDRAAADAVEALIDELPAASSIEDYSHHADIVAARTAYTSLNDSAKGMVDATKLQKLVDCETADAQYAPSAIGTYSMVTDLSQLTSGAAVIITSGDGTVAMGSQTNNNRSTTTGAASANGNITISAETTPIQVFTIESYSTQQNTIVAFKTLNSLDEVSGYLYAAASGNNYLRTQSSVDANAKFYITLESGAFTVVASESSNRNIMRYNSNNSVFSCYQSGQQPLALYVKGSSTPAETFTVTYNGNGGEGTMTDSNAYTSGDTVTTLENTFTRDGYTFANWSTATDGTGTDYSEGETFTITGNVILYAIWEENSGGTAVAGRCYTLVEDASDLVAGAKYIIASGSNSAISTTQATNNRPEASISVSSNIATVTTDAVQVIVLEAGTVDGQWLLNVGDSTKDQYLYAASSSANHLKTRDANSDGNSEWTISIGDSGAATITAKGTNTRNILKYNNTSGLFACYNSGQQSVYIYRLNFEATLLHNVTCDGKGNHSMPEGYSWSDLKAVYNDLPSAEQTALKTSSNEGLIRYDYLIAKYGTSTFENFIGRTITPLHSSTLILGSIVGTNGNNALIIIISIIALSALGGYFYIRRRKEIK